MLLNFVVFNLLSILVYMVKKSKEYSTLTAYTTVYFLHFFACCTELASLQSLAPRRVPEANHLTLYDATQLATLARRQTE